ncbi:MAG: hypothetical protein ACRDHP_07730 [Ktedonobacterales bacterium]
MAQRSFSRMYALRTVVLLLVLGLAGCGTTTVAGAGPGTATATATSPAVATATPQSPCAQLVPGAMPAQGVSGVAGIQLPTGTSISAATTSGGGVGQYTVQSYTLCFQGQESAIDGGVLSPSAPPTSTIGYLVHAGWALNNLFPDPSSVAYLDYCSSGHICVNDSGSPNPFTLVGFDSFASHSGGYTTFRVQVAAIAAPICLNDVGYYSGTPKYTIYEDGNSASSNNPTYHFLMPPGTRVSTFKGGGTAGSTYVYFCSAGTSGEVVNFLSQSMHNDGYTISNATTIGFSASQGSGPTYRIDVSVPGPNNYSLRVFVPM